MTEDYGKCEEYGRFRGGRRRGDEAVRKLSRVCAVVSARLARWLSLPGGKTRTGTVASGGVCEAQRRKVVVAGPLGGGVDS